jgi:16S rRNA processing protein RimM
MAVDEARVCLGVITGAHGVRGAFRVTSFTTDPDDVAAYGPVSAAHGPEGEAHGPENETRGERQLTLKVVGHAKGQVVAQADGIADRDTAEALKGMRLYVARARLPEAEEDEYYHADLIGLAAEGIDGAPLGTVRAVADYGAGDLIEIERDGGQTVLVPFTRAIVPVVDLKGGRIVIDPPEGLFEGEAPEDGAPNEGTKGDER